MDPVLMPVIAGVLGLLVVASLVTAGLYARSRAKGQAIPEPVVNLRQRITAWWFMVAVLVGATAVGPVGMFGLYVLLSALALREILSLARTGPADHLALVVCFFVVLPSHYLFAMVGWYAMFLLAVPVYGFVAIAAALAYSGDTEHFLERMGILLWAVLVGVYFVSYVPMMQHLELPGTDVGSARLPVFLVFVAQISDVFQYIGGKMFGKRKLAPTVSPNKTIEGLVIGGGVAVLGGAALHSLVPFGPFGAAGLALVIVLAGAIGGLVMSAVKRSLDAKDWGAAIAGHGGVMDRLDSVVLSAPLFFHLVVFYADLEVANVRPEWLEQVLFFR